MTARKRVHWSPNHPECFAVSSSDMFQLHSTSQQGEKFKLLDTLAYDTQQIAGATTTCMEWGLSKEDPYLFAGGFSSGQVLLFRFFQDQAVVKELQPRFKRPCNVIAWNPQKPNQLAVGLDRVAEECSVLIWDIEQLPNQNQSDLQYTRHPRITETVGKVCRSKATVALSWLPENPWCIAVGTGFRHLKVYDIRSNTTQAQQLQAHNKSVFGVKFDPKSSHRLATYSEDGLIKLWDLRKLHELRPLMSIQPTHNWRDNPIEQIEWNPNRAGSLAVACAGEDCFRVLDLSGKLADPEFVNVLPNDYPCRTHKTKGKLSSLAWHPQHKHRMLCLCDNTLLQEVRIYDTIPVAWGLESFSFAVNENMYTYRSIDKVPGLAEDPMCAMKRRALAGYGLDLQLNIEILQKELNKSVLGPEHVDNTRLLLRTWRWLAHSMAQWFSEVEEAANLLPPSEPDCSNTSSTDPGGGCPWANGSAFAGLCSILGITFEDQQTSDARASEGLPQEKRSGKPAKATLRTPSRACKGVQTGGSASLFLSAFTVYSSPCRTKALRALGWWDTVKECGPSTASRQSRESEQERAQVERLNLENFISNLERKGQYGKACALALFHMDMPRALASLGHGGNVENSTTRSERQTVEMAIPRQRRPLNATQRQQRQQRQQQNQRQEQHIIRLQEQHQKHQIQQTQQQQQIMLQQHQYQQFQQFHHQQQQQQHQQHQQHLHNLQQALHALQVQQLQLKHRQGRQQEQKQQEYRQERRQERRQELRIAGAQPPQQSEPQLDGGNKTSPPSPPAAPPPPPPPPPPSDSSSESDSSSCGSLPSLGDLYDVGETVKPTTRTSLSRKKKSKASSRTSEGTVLGLLRSSKGPKGDRRRHSGSQRRGSASSPLASPGLSGLPLPSFSRNALARSRKPSLGGVHTLSTPHMSGPQDDGWPRKGKSRGNPLNQLLSTSSSSLQWQGITVQQQQQQQQLQQLHHQQQQQKQLQQLHQQQQLQQYPQSAFAQQGLPSQQYSAQQQTQLQAQRQDEEKRLDRSHFLSPDLPPQGDQNNQQQAQEAIPEQFPPQPQQPEQQMQQYKSPAWLKQSQPDWTARAWAKDKGRRLPNLGLVGLALSGYSQGQHAQTEVPGRDKLNEDLRSHMGNPYLRAVFAFLSSKDCQPSLETYRKVLYEPGLELRERLAFAVRFLPDDDLCTFVMECKERAVKEGRLEALMLTGLGDGVFQVLTSSVRRYGDVQSATLIATLCIALFNHSEAEQKRLLRFQRTYAELLNRWRFWMQRAKLDVARAQLFKRIQTAKGMDDGNLADSPLSCLVKPKPQVQPRCAQCSLSLTQNLEEPQNDNPKQMGSMYGRGQQKGPSKSPAGSKRTRGCPSCRKPLPRCSLCLESLDCAPRRPINRRARAGQRKKGAYRAHDADPQNPLKMWFTWCQGCRHGGHARHMEEWFETHTQCPVTDCVCNCMSMDRVEQPHA